MRIAGPATLLLVVVVSSCYRYVPTTRSTLVPGADVSVTLTSQGSANAASRIGDNAASVDGIVSDTDASGGLTVALHSVRRRGENLASTWSGESLRLSAEDIAEIRGKQFSRGRTVAAWTALGAASAALIIAIAKAVDNVSGSTGGRPIPNP